MDYEKNTCTIANEIKERMRILGIPTTPTTYICFDTDEGVRSIPFYGDWFYILKDNDTLKQAVESVEGTYGCEGVRSIPFYGDWFYILKDNDTLKQAVESVEGTYGCRVYAAIYNRYGELGDVLTLLTISSDESDWEQEREDLKEMQPIAYVHNFTYPKFSEWGEVVLTTNGSVLERIG